MTVAPPALDRPTLLDHARALLTAQTRDLVREAPASDDEDRATTAHLRARYLALSRDGQAAQARNTLSALIAHETARQARARALLDTLGHVPSLLEQVCDAVESSSGTGHRSSSGPHRAAIGLSAADLIGVIEREVGKGPRIALPSRVWAWVRAHHSDPDAVDTVEEWVRAARAVVDPPRPVGLVAACPRCRRRVVHVEDAGERVRRPALQIDRVSGTARCIGPGCGAVWGPDYLAHLAAVLEQQQRDEAAQRPPQQPIRGDVVFSMAAAGSTPPA